MDLHLTGRTAVVTGASKGIGLAIVRHLMDEVCGWSAPPGPSRPNWPP